MIVADFDVNGQRDRGGLIVESFSENSIAVVGSTITVHGDQNEAGTLIGYVYSKSPQPPSGREQTAAFTRPIARPVRAAARPVAAVVSLCSVRSGSRLPETQPAGTSRSAAGSGNRTRRVRIAGTVLPTWTIAAIPKRPIWRCCSVRGDHAPPEMPANVSTTMATASSVHSTSRLCSAPVGRVRKCRARLARLGTMRPYVRPLPAMDENSTPTDCPIHRSVSGPDDQKRERTRLQFRQEFLPWRGMHGLGDCVTVRADDHRRHLHF